MNYIILTHSSTLILSLIALFAIVLSLVVQNKIVACILQSLGVLCVIATVVYALLLGAELREISVYALVFVVLSLIMFEPKKTKEKENADEL